MKLWDDLTRWFFITVLSLFVLTFARIAHAAPTKTPTKTPLPTVTATPTPYKTIGINKQVRYDGNQPYVEWVIKLQKRFVDVSQLQALKDVLTPLIISAERDSSLESDGWIVVRFKIYPKKYFEFIETIRRLNAVEFYGN